MNTTLILTVVCAIGALVAGYFGITKAIAAKAMPHATDPQKKARNNAFALAIGLIILAVLAAGVAAYGSYQLATGNNAPAGGPAPVNTACTVDEVLYFDANGTLKGADCTMPDGTLLSVRQPAKTGAPVLVACTVDEVLYFDANGTLKGADCTMPDGTLLSVRQPAKTGGAPVVINTNPVAGLDYQYDNSEDPMGIGGCNASANPDQYPACWIQRAQAFDKTNVSPVDAIIAIQKLAASLNIPTFDNWTSLVADEHQPMLVWCPGNNCTWIPDTAYPLLQIPVLEARWYFTIGIIQAHPASDPAAVKTVLCPDGDCYAVPLH